MHVHGGKLAFPDLPAVLSRRITWTSLKVRDAADVEQVGARRRSRSEQPLEIIGHGSKRQIGQPMATNALLDLSALNAVTCL